MQTLLLTTSRSLLTQIRPSNSIEGFHQREKWVILKLVYPRFKTQTHFYIRTNDNLNSIRNKKTT